MPFDAEEVARGTSVRLELASLAISRWIGTPTSYRQPKSLSVLVSPVAEVRPRWHLRPRRSSRPHDDGQTGRTKGTPLSSAKGDICGLTALGPRTLWPRTAALAKPSRSV